MSAGSILGRIGAALLLAPLVGCSQGDPSPRWAGFGGDADRGAILIGRESCGDCHVIPGVEGAAGQVGPPLTQFARRTMVAGLLPNTPDNLVRWLKNPQAVTPGNAMPNADLTDQQARDIAAYLYQLK